MNCSKKMKRKIHNFVIKALTALNVFSLIYWICWIDCIISWQDYAGSCIRYNKAWHRNTKIPLTWIEGAGHNSNTDKPEQVNRLIEEFVADIL